MTYFYVTDICTSDIYPFFKFVYWRSILKFMSFFKFSNRCQILKCMAVSHFFKLMSLMYALTLVNKSAIDLRIWKGHRFENTVSKHSSIKDGPDYDIFLQMAIHSPLLYLKILITLYADNIVFMS